MEIKIVTKNFSSNIGVHDVAKKELQRVEKMFAPDTIFDVCIKKHQGQSGKDEYKCDITIKNGKRFIRGYAEGDSVQSAIDFAVDSLKRKARKVKTFELKKRRGYGDFITSEYVAEPENIENSDFTIQRIKEIEVAIMSPEEAQMQMELIGHNFFVFKDIFGAVNIMYKRDQGYGIIVAR